MKIFKTIFSRKEFIDKPLVLIDIGASGSLNPEWKEIAQYATCIACDADAREMGYLKKNSVFKKLIVTDKIIVSDNRKSCDFYLTKDPFCSSTLPPDIASHWSICKRFELEKKVVLESTNLSGIAYIDWFKTDSQGTDLQLFKSLGEAMESVLAVDFEPGLIDAYGGEDKLWRILGFMEERNYMITDMRVRYVKRISTHFPVKEKGIRDTPAWAELSYLKNNIENLSIREYLLLWVFATIQKQHGFAYDIATEGYYTFHDDLFSELQVQSVQLADQKARKVAVVDKILRFKNRVINLLK